MSEVKVSKVRLDSLIPDDSNANKGTIRGTKALENSIQQFGFIEAGTLDKNNRIMGGNKRAEAVAAINLSDEVIIVETDGSKPIYLKTPYDLDTPEGRKIAYALNRIHELNFELDPAQLVIDLESGLDLLDLWNPDELSVMLEGAADSLLGGDGVKDVEPQIDKAAELQKKWGTALGQVWQLGEHRIVIADCTNEATIKTLLDGERLNLLPTDPPYNVGIEYGDNVDDSKRDEDYEVFSRTWFRLWQSISDRQVITPGYYNLACWSRLFEKPYHIGTWTKTNSMTHGHVSRFACYEPILFYGRGWKRERHNDIFDYPVSGQSFATGEKLTVYHPCPKPLKMWLDLLENYSESRDLIGEPFLGSGTTLVACEQLGRKVRGCEISPDFAAVSIQRWADLTARDPIRLSE